MYTKLSSENSDIFYRNPNAVAKIKGNRNYPDLYGEVKFFRVPLGTVVVTELFGLPDEGGDCADNIYAFHIHENGSCTGDAEDEFANAGMHFDMNSCPHPAHSGDMPPLFAFHGYAWNAFYTERFTPDMVLGRSVIVHSQPDDFHTQPSGNAGMKIACGVIEVPSWNPGMPMACPVNARPANSQPMNSRPIR